MSRTSAVVLAELRGNLTPLMWLPDEASLTPGDEPNSELPNYFIPKESIQEATEARRRVNELLDELTAALDPEPEAVTS